MNWATSKIKKDIVTYILAITLVVLGFRLLYVVKFKIAMTFDKLYATTCNNW